MHCGGQGFNSPHVHHFMGVGQLSGASPRVRKVVGGTTTRYIFSGTKVIADYVNGALSKEYIYSGSRLLVTRTQTVATLIKVQGDSFATPLNSSWVSCLVFTFEVAL